MKANPFLFLIALFLIFGCAAQPGGKRMKEPPIPSKPVKTEIALESQLGILTDQIVTSLSQKKKSKIAVIEFSNLRGQATEFGRYLAEELITRLYLTNKFEVIERQLLNKVLKEHQLNMSGLIDASSAKELGRILGVDAIASGSVTDLDNSVKVNARLISTETGKIFSVASVTISKDNTVRRLMGETITAKTNKKMEPGAPASPQAHSLNMIVKQNDFTFELKSCEIKDRTVTCSLIITNNTEDDRELVIWFYKTKIYDQSGNEYMVCKVKLANSSSRPNPSCKWGGSSRIAKLLIPGVPTPATLVFEKVSSEAERISLLNLNLGSMGDVKFRNIPLAR